jgi:PAS domain-containing protein
MKSVIAGYRGYATPPQFIMAQPSGAPSAHAQYLTWKPQKSAFLFVPALVVPHDSNEPVSPRDISSLMGSDEQLARDMRVGMSLAPLLDTFDWQVIERDVKVVQSYFMTETGVLLIRKSGTDEQSAYYAGLLPAHRFFPERIYFWPAARASEADNVFDSVSDVYIDAGGNGPVKTYCKKLSAVPAYVICMDGRLALSDNEVALTQRIAFLDGIYAHVECNVAKGAEDCDFKDPRPPGRPKSSLLWMSDDLREWNAKNQLAQFLGRVATKACDTGCDERNIELSMPWSTSIHSGERMVDFYWADIDLTRVERLQKRYALGAIGSLVICLALAFMLFQDYVLKARQQKSMLQDVSRVMQDAPTPFAWTNERNEFVKANDSFVELLGYSNFEDLRVKPDKAKRTFKELLDPEYKAKYDYVLLQSQRGLKSDEYWAVLQRKDKSKFRALIHGEKVHVPLSLLSLNAVPYRFGVILQHENV